MDNAAVSTKELVDYLRHNPAGFPMDYAAADRLAQLEAENAALTEEKTSLQGSLVLWQKHEEQRQAEVDALRADLARYEEELGRLRGRVAIEDHKAVLADLARARAVLDSAELMPAFSDNERVVIRVGRAAWQAWRESRRG